jgi:hypothetical protein
MGKNINPSAGMLRPDRRFRAKHSGKKFGVLSDKFFARMLRPYVWETIML